MQKSLLTLTLLGLLAFAACKKDDNKDCTPGKLVETIVGSWKETPILGVGNEVTFKSDFTGTAADGSLFETEINGTVIRNFTWKVNGDSTLTVTSAGGGGTFELDYEMTKLECDRIVFDVFGLGLELKRK